MRLSRAKRTHPPLRRKLPRPSYPPAQTARLTWSGEVPPQKWTNFYMKVLTKFAASQDLDMRLTVIFTIDANSDGPLSPQKIEETKMALRELGLDDGVEVK